jgi:hypothetical protein
MADLIRVALVIFLLTAFVLAGYEGLRLLVLGLVMIVAMCV